MYKWEIINLSTGEVIEQQKRFRTRVNAVRGAATYILDPTSSVDEDHDITLMIRDSKGNIVGGLKDFPARRVKEMEESNW